jgi:CPA1 family monovalent cation:H+ antiporter
MHDSGIESVIVVILLAALVAMVARRLRVPYTVGLLLAGIAVSFLHLPFETGLSKDILFKALLPPLIFEAALYIKWSELRRDLGVIGVFATLGVVLSAAVTAAIMHFAVGWQVSTSVIFGVLIAATDPVSVVAMLKEAKVEGRLRLLIESESLFNDGTAAVAFAVAIAFFAGENVGPVSAAWMLVTSVAGGVLIGAVVGGLVVLLVGRTYDYLVELAMTTVAAFGSFWLAEEFHFSGILATTAAGLLIGNWIPRGTITSKGEDAIEHFWDFAAFVVNAIVFVLIGINLAYQDIAIAWPPIVIAMAAVLLGRAAAVYPSAALFRFTKRKVPYPEQHLLFWGGLRGALALALALSVPASFPDRQAILTVTFGVVAFSVLVQGLSVPAVMRWLGLK